MYCMRQEQVSSSTVVNYTKYCYDQNLLQLLYCSFTQQTNKNQYGTPILYLLFCIQSNQKV